LRLLFFKEIEMHVSSATSALAKQAVLNPRRAEGAVEGTKPDGDGDQDDAARVAATKAVSPASGPMGKVIDVFA